MLVGIRSKLGAYNGNQLFSVLSVVGKLVPKSMQLLNMSETTVDILF